MGKLQEGMGKLQEGMGKLQEGRECFYLMTHPTHFIHGYMASSDMVKNHSGSERRNLLPPHWLLFPISKLFYMHLPTGRRIHTMTCVTLVVEHWLEEEIVQWVYHEGTV